MNRLRGDHLVLIDLYALPDRRVAPSAKYEQALSVVLIMNTVAMLLLSLFELV